MNIEIKPLGMIIGSLKGIFPKLMANQMHLNGIEYSFDQMLVLIIVRYCTKYQTVQQDIAEIMGKDKSVILRMIDVLEKDGLLHRTPDAKDRRRNILSLSEKGFEFTELFRAIETEISKALLVGLKEDEIENFYKVINHIQQRAEEI